MTFDEIIRINYLPFDERSISKQNYRNLKRNQGIANIFFYNFVYAYFQKINEKYHTNFWGIKLPNPILVRVLNHDMQSEEFNSLLFNLERILEQYFFEVIDDIGFEGVGFTLDGEMFSPHIWDGNKKYRKRYVKKRLMDIFPGKQKSWIPLFWHMADHIEESIYSLEGGRVYILRNKSLGCFFDFCEKHPDVIEKELYKEYMAIYMILQEVINPFSFYCTNYEGICGKYAYFYFDIGVVNYGVIDFLQLRPSWVIACFVYKSLFDDFKMKVSILSAKYPELRDFKWI